MTAIDFVRRAPIRGAALALAVLAFVSSPAGADDAEIAKLLKAKGAEVKESQGSVTSLTIPDGSKLTDDEFQQMTRLSHLKMVSLSKGLNDERLARLATVAGLEYLQTNLAQV